MKLVIVYVHIQVSFNGQEIMWDAILLTPNGELELEVSVIFIQSMQFSGSPVKFVIML